MIPIIVITVAGARQMKLHNGLRWRLIGANTPLVSDDEGNSS